MESVLKVLRKVKDSTSSVAFLSDNERNGLLIACGMSLKVNEKAILEANKIDVLNAEKNGKPDSFIDRLMLNSDRIDKMCDGINTLTDITSPVGDILDSWKTAKGLNIEKICVPLGVIAIVFEARPNVAADCIALAIKSGNAIVLRGGSDAINSNIAIVKAIKDGIKKCGYSPDFIGLIEDVSHESVNFMLKQRDYIDVIIPRGGQNLIHSTIENATVPVIETGLGNCHVYVHEKANLDEALKIAVSAKISRVSVCNSAEKLLIDKSISKEFVPKVVAALRANKVEVRGGEDIQEFVPDVINATEEDYYKEYNAMIMTLKVVDSLEDAAKWINKYSTHHSDSIITCDKSAADKFALLVDSACVFVNTTTRYSDGFEFGFGAEVGISTQKLHARGPMGIKELTTYKYVIDSDYLIR